MNLFVVFIRLAHLEASEAHLQKFVEWKLNRDVSKPEERWCETRVKGGDTLLCVHLPERIEGVAVVPWRAVIFRGARADLGHESGLHNPDGISN